MVQHDATVWGTRAPRREVNVPAVFTAGGGVTGNGGVTDLSTTGARIEEPDLFPGVGNSLVLSLSPVPSCTPVKLYAEVVRKTDTGGFCVRFHLADSKQRMLRLMMLSHPFLAAGSKATSPVV